MKLNRKWLLVIALVLSMATAISGTLAYLTDTDSSVNTFTVGNVKIELTEPSYEGNTPTLLPGVEITKNPQITNTGRTDAWVWMKITVPTDLMNYIDWNITDWTKTTETSGDNTIVTMKRTSLLESGDTTEAAFTKVSLPSTLTSMPESIAESGVVAIVVNAYAIQDEPFENIDAAMEAYDGKESSDGAVTVSSSDELKAALTSKAPIIILEDGEYNWSGTGHNGTAQTVKLYGESKNVVLKVTNEGGEGGDNDFDGYTVSFNNLTIKSDNQWTAGWKRMNATYNDCVIDGIFNLMNNTHVFNNCTLNQTAEDYCIWVYGASEATFNNCTFNCIGKAIYLDGGKTLKVNNCTFIDSNNGIAGKAAIETGKTYGCDYTLIVNNASVTGFAINQTGTNTGMNLWGNKDSLTGDQLSVTIDDTKVY